MLALALALVFAPPALADDDANQAAEEGLLKLPPKKPGERPVEFDWFGEPVSRLEGYHCTVCWSHWGLDIVTGIEGGLKYRQRAEPNLYGFTRGSLEIQAGLLDQSLGVDLRLGTFFGQDHRYYRIYTGPDFFGNTYPLFGSGNYTLPWTEGVAWHTQGYVKVTRDIWLGLSVTPAFAFREKRRLGEIDGPWDELAWEATFSYLGNPRITVGFRWEKNAASVFQSILIAAQL